jgi:MoaA/NifB/PqqE/SkfB family radical SAM enzyme
MSNTYCVLLWLSITVDTNGDIKPCCVSTDFIKKIDGTHFNLGNDSINDIYNSPDFLKIRQQMINGEEVSGCSQCYKHERSGGNSQRIIHNEKWKDQQFNDVIADTSIQYFDLRFGNLCNLSCRSCNPRASSKFAKVLDELRDTEIKRFHHSYTLSIDEWYDTKMFEKNIESQLSCVTKLYLTGGEPTVIKKNIEMLERFNSLGYSKNITLVINSNMTNLNSTFYQLLANFKQVVFFASIDGTGAIQEYLRYPSNWNQIDKNIKTLLTYDNMIIRTTPVIQITNLNKIVDLFEYVESINREQGKSVIDIMPIILENPSYLNLSYLPKEYKMMCWERIQEWLNTKCQFQSEIFYNKMEVLKNKCLEEFYCSDTLKKYIEFNSILDNHWEHHLQSVNPELCSIL